MTNNLLLLNQVARQLHVKPYQIAYAISAGHVEEPELRIANKRIFQPADIKRLAKHFESKHNSTLKGGERDEKR